jgi:hypothetical protein
MIDLHIEEAEAFDAPSDIGDLWTGVLIGAGVGGLVVCAVIFVT